MRHEAHFFPLNQTPTALDELYRTTIVNIVGEILYDKYGCCPTMHKKEDDNGIFLKDEICHPCIEEHTDELANVCLQKGIRLEIREILE